MSTALRESPAALAASASADPLTTGERAAWRGLLHAHASLVKALDGALEVAHGFPLSSYEALEALDAAPAGRMRMCELAARARLSRSGLTRLVDRLQRAGLIERADCSSDARGSFAVLTSEGRAALVAAGPTYAQVVRARLLDHLSEADLARLVRLWEHVLAAAPPRDGFDCCP
jgi:DNA-binding MarR family transcriptional regulator